MSNSNSGYTEAKALEREQAGSSGNTQRRGSLLSRGLERAVTGGCHHRLAQVKAWGFGETHGAQ